MKKTITSLTAITAVLISILLLASCNTESLLYTKEQSATNGFFDVAITEDKIDDSNDTVSSVADNRKDIEYITLDIETKKYSEFLDSLNSEIKRIGAYIESSNIYGSGLDMSRNRFASLVIRVPKTACGDFTSFVSENSAVTSETKESDDVTVEYVDTESRIKALKLEKEALEDMLSKADTVDNIITIRDRLTEVISKIESYESRLRTIDNLVDYTTVTVNISEVEHTTPGYEVGVMQQIGRNILINLEDIGNFFVDIFVFIASSLPYILILAIVAAVAVITIKRIRKKKATSTTKVSVVNPEKDSSEIGK